MTLSQSPGSLKRFGRTPWRFQQTFQTPLQNLEPFVTTILSARVPIQTASVIFDQVVFEPKHLLALFTRYALVPEYGHDWCVATTNPQEVKELLRATLSDWVDFLFIPTPKPFVIYADHDEYTTFFANTKSNLNGVVEALTAGGFRNVPDYERTI
jgi:hypothetical protein